MALSFRPLPLHGAANVPTYPVYVNIVIGGCLVRLNKGGTMNTVGERLKQARTAQGLTQERLAEGLATKGFISQVERNLTTPSLPRLRLLAERLGLPLSYFVEGPAARHSGYLL